MTRTYLAFLEAALHDDGAMHNRRNPDGTWGDEVSTDDHWGRALWALGTAAAHLDDALARGPSTGSSIAPSASPLARAMAYAAARRRRSAAARPSATGRRPAAAGSTRGA